jgi:predicted CoA-substrate-specific enzyme activase
MFFAGIDIGSLATKVCIIDENGKILGYVIQRTTASIVDVGRKAYKECLKKVGVNENEIGYSIVTGYGRNLAVSEIADEKVTEITCHAIGAKNIFPECHTVIDIGGQDSKVMRIDDYGRVVKFTMNDKCAAGTGRFLEVMAGVLGIEIDEMSDFSKKSKNKVPITSTCTVFAESEVISLIASGKNPEDIVAGLNEAIAKRVGGLARQVGVEREVVMTGGVAKNLGVVEALEKEIGCDIKVPEEPQIVGAFGAGILAKKRKFDTK